MPWKELSKTMIREEFVKRVLAKEKSKSALCREYNICRPTGDKWIKRYLNGESLADKSRAPFKTVNKTPEAVEKLIVDYRKSHPAIGATKIRKILLNRGELNIPSNSTVNAILKRNGCITKEASQAAEHYERFVKSAPNEMWQSDFKGYFTLKNGCRCYPLNILDDHSRMCLCSEALNSESMETVQPIFSRVFHEYGLPFSLLCDNGNPWGTAQSTGYTKFEIWLMELGVLVIHGRIFHPQTQGKEERFNRSMKDELLKHHEFRDLQNAQQYFDEYRDFYNNERPHHSLNLDVPAEHYHKSNKKMPSKIEEWYYPNEYQLRKVKSTGYITYNNQGYYLSESFGNKTIAIKESSTHNCINLYYRQFKIGKINLDERSFVSRKIYLTENDPRY